MVLNTSELLPEPETPVNTVSRRFGSSTLTSLRLFTRAPCTRIRSWRSATYSAGNWVSVRVAMLIVSQYLRRGRLRGRAFDLGEYRPSFDGVFNLAEFEYGTRAEGVGFEPTEALQPQQFSRLSQST